MSKMRNLLLISSSRVHGHQYMEVAESEINDFLSSKNVKTILFIPYAMKKYDEYLQLVTPVFKKIGCNVEGIHHHNNPTEAVNKAEAVFIGGGNTFLLLKTLYQHNLVETINKRVLQDGMLYMGSSAGTNVATCSINTTNDMPIVHPPSFNALNLVPFNINPHYIETDPMSKHKGETRDQRIEEFLELEESGPVLGLREGCMLRVVGDKAVLKGIMGAKLFIPGQQPKEYAINSDVSFLFESHKNN